MIRGKSNLSAAYTFLQNPLSSATLSGALSFLFPNLKPNSVRERNTLLSIQSPNQAMVKGIIFFFFFRSLTLLLAACEKCSINWSFKAYLFPKAKAWLRVNYSEEQPDMVLMMSEEQYFRSLTHALTITLAMDWALGQDPQPSFQWKSCWEEIFLLPTPYCGNPLAAKCQLGLCSQPSPCSCSNPVLFLSQTLTLAYL